MDFLMEKNHPTAALQFCVWYHSFSERSVKDGYECPPWAELELGDGEDGCSRRNARGQSFFTGIVRRLFAVPSGLSNLRVPDEATDTASLLFRSYGLHNRRMTNIAPNLLSILTLEQLSLWSQWTRLPQKCLLFLQLSFRTVETVN